ncbi:MAG: DEAD/DEAH box helicase, partial [Candidatus Aenigmarchaeota archaeon]|nr:DEAD/DEAH box helicase [Candidatus Aenigmarchaeota archaeon]
MYSIVNIKPRKYQENIAKTGLSKNTLVVLPTGLGKTLIAILVAIKRLNRYPNSKVLMLAPTRPLCAQHQKTFQNFTNIENEKIVL